MSDTEPTASTEQVTAPQPTTPPEPPRPSEPASAAGLPNRDAIRAELEETRSRYHALLDSLSDADWEKKSGNPSWNVRQLMWHLGRGMEFFSETVDQCRKGKAPNPPGFLIDIGNTLLTRWGSRGATRQSVGTKYDEAHAKLLSVLDGVRDDEWQKGVTAYGTKHTIESVFPTAKAHFDEHEADIKTGLGRS